MSEIPLDVNSLPTVIANLHMNGSHLGEIIKYCEGSILAAGNTPLQPVIAKTKKYVEDSLCSIADSILSVSQLLTEHCEQQAGQLETLNKRVKALHTVGNSTASAVNHHNLCCCCTASPLLLSCNVDA